MTAQDDLRAMEMARAMYEAWPAPKSIDEDNMDPVPWDELPRGAVHGWMSRARNLIRNGLVLVPTEATADMIQAGYARDPLACDVEDTQIAIYSTIWEAMVQVARSNLPSKERGNG